MQEKCISACSSKFANPERCFKLQPHTKQYVKVSRDNKLSLAMLQSWRIWSASYWLYKHQQRSQILLSSYSRLSLDGFYSKRNFPKLFATRTCSLLHASEWKETVSSGYRTAEEGWWEVVLANQCEIIPGGNMSTNLKLKICASISPAVTLVIRQHLAVYFL